MEERRKVLKMLEEGKIKADEAEELLESIEKKTGVAEKSKSSSKGKKLRVRVETNEGENVNINIPLSLAKLITKFIRKHYQESVEFAGIDLDEVLSHIDEQEDIKEDIVNVDADGQKVRIYIE